MIIALVLRFVQLVFAAIVLGLSVTLIKDQLIDSAPATINYNAFAGAFGMVTAAVGIAAIWVEPIGGLIMAVIDGLAGLFFLAGGLAVVIILRGISCSSNSDENFNKQCRNSLLNAGSFTEKGVFVCAADNSQMHKRCKENEAAAAFEFMSFALCAGCAVLSFLAMKRGISSKGALV